MIESIKICFYKYANFSGTAKRAEFWPFYLFCIITNIITWIIFGDTSVITFYISAILVLPEVSDATRRLRDINKSGWWQLLYFTIVGIIPLLVWYSRKSEKQRSKEINSSFEKLVPFLELAKEGINNWKSWTLGIITIFFCWVILGSFVVEIFLPATEYCIVSKISSLFIPKRVYFSSLILMFNTSDLILPFILITSFQSSKSYL